MAIARITHRWFGHFLIDRVEPGSALWYFRRDPLAIASLTIIGLLIFAAIFAPWVAPYPHEGQGDPNIVNKFLPPSASHLLGTDSLGRDLLSRIIFGSRTSLAIALLIVSSSALVGTLLGAVAGYVGGWMDNLIMRVTDMFLAFPPLLLAIAIAAALGPSFMNTIIAISLTWWPWYTRIVRGQSISLRERHFVKAAQSMGVKNPIIVRRHILPNVMTPVLVQATADLGAAILTAASLSFIGLGPQPPIADWGMMISEGRLYVLSGRWWIATFSGLAIFLTVLSFNLLGDSVREVADPKLRHG